LTCLSVFGFSFCSVTRPFLHRVIASTFFFLLSSCALPPTRSFLPGLFFFRTVCEVHYNPESLFFASFPTQHRDPSPDYSFSRFIPYPVLCLPSISFGRWPRNGRFRFFCLFAVRSFSPAFRWSFPSRFFCLAHPPHPPCQSLFFTLGGGYMVSLPETLSISLQARG